MCSGASKIMVNDLNLPTDVERRLIDNGLGTAQAILDEGRTGLRTIGLNSVDITGVSEAVHQETGEWLE
jgi:hypothetical protein